MNNTSIYFNDIKADLFDKEVIAQSYSIASFGDISTRSSNYSNTFKIPLTANNKTIFENSEVVVNDSILPYSKVDCKIYVDGIPVVLGYAQLVSCSDVYEVKVFSGNSDFYSLIKDKYISELDLSDYNHTWNAANVEASMTNTDGYIYALIDYHSDSPNGALNNVDREIDIRFLYFSFYKHTILSKIVSEAGYTISGGLLSDPNYLSTIIPFSNDKLLRETESQLIKVGTNTDQSFLYSGAVSLGTQTAILNDETSDGFFDNGSHWNTSTYRYTASATITATFSINVNTVTSVANTFLNIRLKKNGVTAESIQLVSPSGINTATFAPISLVASDYIEIEYAPTTLSTPALGTECIKILSVSTVLSNEVDDSVVFGQDIDVALNMPKLKQSDFLKSILQEFGSIMLVDNSTNTITLRNFSDIKNNIANAKDWSAKVDETNTTELRFTYNNYSQINKCTYKEDDSVIKPEGTDYDLLINNKNLEAEGDLFESPFAASESVERMVGIDMIQIKKVTSLVLTEKTQPRVAVVELITGGTSIDFTDGVSVVGSTTDYARTYFIEFGKSFNLGWGTSLIDLYSSDIEDVLQRTKVITELLRLNSADINQLDMFKPIWLDKHQCYFFISEIKQYKINEPDSTEVELVKLN